MAKQHSTALKYETLKNASACPVMGKGTRWKTVVWRKGALEPACFTRRFTLDKRRSRGRIIQFARGGGILMLNMNLLANF